ncbi:hypothetical protein TW65_71777 [Stemphylium lycopersici]|nr:hypothetical protein TW65_71777 [Stemphylium lycopersici]
MARFDNMPAELRNYVYDQILLENKPRFSPRHFRGHETSLFTVSKQLHQEATSYFYQHNEITIDIPSPKASGATILSPVADRYLRFLRRLRIYALITAANSTSQQELADTISSLANIGANFEDIYITIQSTLSRLINPMVDDSVLGIDHPITVALRVLLDSKAAKVVRLHLHQVWFAPCVAQDLEARYGDRILFISWEGSPRSPHFVQRLCTGFYVSSHMIAMDLDEESIADAHSPENLSIPSTPTSIPSSVASAFADLDMFSVNEFQLRSDDEKNDESKDGSANEESFFSGIDIEEWEASTEIIEENSSEYEEMETDDGDDEEEEDLEDVQQEDIDAIMSNMEETAHHIANEADITYCVLYVRITGGRISAPAHIASPTRAFASIAAFKLRSREPSSTNDSKLPKSKISTFQLRARKTLPTETKYISPRLAPIPTALPRRSNTQPQPQTQ